MPNFDELMKKRISTLEGRPGLVLHSCCAVCLSSVLERLSPHFKLTVLCCNPNISPRSEYDRRRDEQKRLLGLVASDADFVEVPCDHDGFLREVAGLEGEREGGARCAVCFSLRLRAAARYAAQNGIPFFCSTLSVSPHKDAAAVNLAGERAAESFGVEWLYSDFKKRDGYLRSVTLARQLELYRQSYCGCEFACPEAAER